MPNKKNPLEPALTNVLDKMRDCSLSMGRVFTGFSPWFHDYKSVLREEIQQMSREERTAFLFGVWVPDSSEGRLLEEIKDSHYKVYNERLTGHEAHVKLEKMRVDVDRDIAMRKKP